MQRFSSKGKGGMMKSLALSLIFSTLFIGISVGAATTISTNINTGGNLIVSGTTGLTGLTTMVYASSTGQSVSGNLTVGGRATTTGSNGNIETAGTLTVTGTSGFTGLSTFVYASSTGQSLTRNLLVNGMATTTGSNGNLEIQGGLTVGNATTNSLAGTLLLAGYTTALEPVGVTQGTFYYNSTNKTLKMFDGSNWFTVGTTTGGLSLNTNNIRLDDLTLRNMTLGTTTQQGSGQGLVTLEATTTTAIPLSIVGFNGHTGHLLDVLSGSSIAGPKLLYISSSGGLFASSTGAFGGTLTVGGTLTATTSAYLATTGGSAGVGTTTPGATFSVHGNALVSNTLSAASLIASSTLTVTGATPSTIPYASTTAITNSGLASTSSLIIGGNSINGTVSGMIFGTCTLQQTSILATSTLGVQCTGATGVSTAYSVFVQATSTLASSRGGTGNASGGFFIVSASSTAANVIGVELSNLTGANATPAGTLNFWAVR